MGIYKPTLPPRAGYVERDGMQFPTEETKRIIDIEKKTLLANSAVGILFTLEAKSESPRFDEQTILEHLEYFITWTQDYTGERGSIVNEDGILYRALHDIGTAYSGMRPSETPSLWKRIGNPGDEWREWIQPVLGVDDLYRMGDKVSHNDGHWICVQENTPDGNTFEPGVWGWEAVA